MSVIHDGVPGSDCAWQLEPLRLIAARAKAALERVPCDGSATAKAIGADLFAIESEARVAYATVCRRIQAEQMERHRNRFAAP